MSERDMSPDDMRRRRGRNYALGGVLVVIAVLMFVVTLVKLKGP